MSSRKRLYGSPILAAIQILASRNNIAHVPIPNRDEETSSSDDNPQQNLPETQQDDQEANSNLPISSLKRRTSQVVNLKSQRQKVITWMEKTVNERAEGAVLAKAQKKLSFLRKQY
ncbi:hypothetical protein RCL1_008168 [Eukaryota sp. TZLM3-RCL]